MKTVSDQSFDVLFNPKNVMIIEAKEKVGFFISGFKRQGFDLSNLYLVSPNKEELYNIKCYSSIDDVPVDDLDLVILSIRRELLIQSLNEILTKKNVKYIHIFTAGTGESGKVGKQIELEIKQIMNDHENTRAIGPNCMGLYSPRGKIAYYSSFPVERGNIGLIFQSGDLHSKMVKFGSFKYGLTFSLGVSIGNCIDIQISELVKYYNNDEETDMICVYFEGISQFHKKEGINLFRVLKNVRKPVFFMRGGKTTRGQSAVLTHTGSVATDKRIWDAIYRQTPILEVPSSLDELVDYAYMFNSVYKRYKKRGIKPIFPKGKRALVILWSGGFGILATDRLTELGIKMPQFEGEALEKLKEIYPIKIGSLSNPFDLPWVTSQKIFLDVTKAAVDENIDIVIVETDAWKDDDGEEFKGYYSNLLELKKHCESLDKIFVIILHQYPSESRSVFYKKLVDDEFLVYPTIEAATYSFLKLYEYGVKMMNFSERENST